MSTGPTRVALRRPRLRRAALSFVIFGDRPRLATDQRGMSLVVVPPPTPNGGLHLGHMSGPYLYADIYRRWLQTNGADSGLWVHTDNSQLYCLNAARRKGMDPHEFIADRAATIEGHLRIAGIEPTGFTGKHSQAYVESINAFFGRLLDSQHVQLEPFDFFVDNDTGEVLADALVEGRCPVCLAGCSGGICEACGSPNDPTDLIGARPAHGTGGIHVEERVVMTLNLERFRDDLRTRLLDGAYQFRPRLGQLLERLLNAPLPRFPLTFPGPWGCPVSIDQLQGQVFNPWAEILPGHLFYSQKNPTGMRWDDQCGPVLFFGFDNSFFYAIVHGALLLAHEGRYAFPRHFVTNEFYELQDGKFSSSLGRAIWIDDAVAEFGADALRFYLCLTNPAYQRSTFVPQQARRAIDERLRAPLGRLLKARAKLDSLPDEGEWRELPLARIQAEIAGLYDLRNFDLRAVAGRLAELIAVLADDAEAAVEASNSAARGPLDRGLKSWGRLATPIMPTLGRRIAAMFEGDPSSTSTRVFESAASTITGLMTQPTV